jgi:hypothetical protein
VRGINDLESVYDSSEFLGMTFYFGAPYSTPEGDNRASWYGIGGTPTVMFGGTVESVGASGTMFYTYDPIVQNQMATASPLIMDASYALVSDEIMLSVQIDVDLAVSGSNNQVLFFVCQDGLHEQSNMVVDMLAGEPFTLTTPGQTVTVDRTFAMDPSWNELDLRLIIVVQNMTTKEIHQATLAVADYAARIIIDAEPDGVEASWNLTGPDMDISKSGDLTINLWAAGTYTITWDDIPHWTTPTNNPETLTVAEDGVITFLGMYSDGPFISLTAGDLGNTGPGRAVSLVDVDNDGDLDIHVANEGAADQMLRNDGGGVFSDIATGPIAEAGASRGAAWADLNGDGNLDVFLSRNNEINFLMIGDGNGGFTIAPNYGLDDEGPSISSSWVDYDLDGQLDLYVVNHGEDNTLLKGFGDVGGGTFIFSDQVGLVSDGGNGNAACWGDGDLDGRPDLFIANQFQENLFLQNLEIGFFDITNSAGLGNTDKALGAAWGDYNNDGAFDLYVANEGMSDLLYRCSGPFQLTRVTGTNLGDTGFGRGVVWVDFNNDTFLDLYVVRNGQTDLLLLGDGAGNFERVPVGPAEADGPGNAVACGDMDGDGDVDVFISREGASNALLINELADGNRWIKLQLTGAGFNTCAIGARIVLSADGVSQTRMVTSGSGYLCNNALDPHFGLGASTTVDQIEIFWPDGTYQVVGPAFSNQTLAIVQGEDPASTVDDIVPTRVTALGLAHPNPFNPSTTIEFALARPEDARLDVFTVDGRLVRTLVDRGLTAGPHTATWDGVDHLGRAVASGTYFYRLTTAGGFSEAGRMVLVK